MNSDEIVEKLTVKIKNTSWYNVLRWFLISREFKEIIDLLIEFKKENRSFTPAVKDFFNPFKISDYNKLKVVFLFDSPYKKLGWSNGVPIACPNTNKKTPQFKFLENAINRQLPRDLSDFGNGEVLLLNVSLTTDIYKEGSLLHYKIWHPFINYLLDKLSTEKKYIFIVVGEKPKEYALKIDDFNPKFFIDEIPNVFDFKIEWDFKDVFNKVNETLVKNNQLPINW